MNPPFPWPPSSTREEDPEEWAQFDREMEIAVQRHVEKDEEQRIKRNTILVGILCFGMILTGILIGMSQ